MFDFCSVAIPEGACSRWLVEDNFRLNRAGFLGRRYPQDNQFPKLQLQGSKSVITLTLYILHCTLKAYALTYNSRDYPTRFILTNLTLLSCYPQQTKSLKYQGSFIMPITLYQMMEMIRHNQENCHSHLSFNIVFDKKEFSTFSQKHRPFVHF